MMHKNTENIYVALSGGVDSAVAAALLQKEGHNVTGVYMRQYDSSLGAQDDYSLQCTWQEDRRSAISVAAHLDIPFKEWDFRKEYHKEVVDYLVQEYKKGNTPNPDVMCNTHIKFGAFLKNALIEGADAIATGHYVKKVHKNGCDELHIAMDKDKDQSYFLWNLNQEQVAKSIFPLGDLAKQEVRELAKKFKLPNAERKESQGVCFVGEISMKEFLKDHIKQKKGKILDIDTHENLGTHEGVGFYTIGQRHGIGLEGGAKTYFVAKKDPKKNVLYVAKGHNHEALLANTLEFDRVNWIVGEPKERKTYYARIRYRQKLQKIQMIKKERGFQAQFHNPQEAAAIGQMLVVYEGAKMLGGGIITSIENA